MVLKTSVLPKEDMELLVVTTASGLATVNVLLWLNHQGLIPRRGKSINPDDK
jgi:hypothetical protein